MGAAADVIGCTFKGNYQGLRIANSNEVGDVGSNAMIKDCEFLENKGSTLILYASSDNDSTVTNCVFKDNTIAKQDSNNKGIISLEEVEHYGKNPRFSGGNTVFKDCIITGNSGGLYTVIAQAGEKRFENCLIEGNTADITAGIYANPFCELHLKDTVIKGNHSYGKESWSCGGVTMDASTYIQISISFSGGDVLNPGDDDETNLGYFRSKLIMEGGAIYNNTNDREGGAQDLYVDDEKSLITMPDVKDMKDGDMDFSDAGWTDENHGAIIGTQRNLSEIFIDPVNGDDENAGHLNEPVKTMGRVFELIEKYSNCNTVKVINPVEFPEEQTLDFGGFGKDISLVREKSNRNEVLKVNSGAKLKLRNVKVDGLERAADKALIRVDKDAALDIDGTVTITNGGRDSLKGLGKNDKYERKMSNDGGAIYSKGEVLMDGSTISNNYALRGGGILMDGPDASLTMKSGSIKSNTALPRVYLHDDGTVMSAAEKQAMDRQNGSKAEVPEIEYGENVAATDYKDSYGGGVALINGAAMSMDSGSIVNDNKAWHSGGGIAVGGQYIWNGGSTGSFTMSGGNIDNNEAIGAGGGLFIQCEAVGTITGGSICNNTARGNKSPYAGGGIYVNGYHKSDGKVKNGVLNIYNVEFAYNSADEEGGAMAWCGVGSGGISEVNGVVIHDNSAKAKTEKYRMYGEGSPMHDYDPMACDVLISDLYFCHTGNDKNGDALWSIRKMSPSERSETFTAERMINGASFDWQEVTPENPEGVPADPEQLRNNTRMLRLKTGNVSKQDIDESSKDAKVRVNNNSSGTSGGGLGSNGEINISSKQTYIDISVEKKWEDKGHEGERPESVKVQLLRDGEVIDSKMIKPDEKGDWKAVFEELPKYKFEGEGKEPKGTYEYSVREDVTYAPSGGKAIKDVYETTVKNDGNEYVITNKYKEEPPKEDKPDEPKNPDKPDESLETENPDKPSRPNNPAEKEDVTTAAKPNNPGTVVKSEKPDSKVRTSDVKSGDDSHAGIIAAAGAVALAAIVLALFTGRKRRNDK